VSKQASKKKGETKGIHWIQAVGWGIFISVVMFGFGFLSGTRFGERKAVDRVSDTVVQRMPLRLEIAPHPEEESGFPVDDSEELWGYLEDEQDTPFSNETAAARVRDEEHTSREKGNAGLQRGSSEEAVDYETATYTVQVGAFKDKKRAGALQQNLTKKDYPSPRVLEAEIQGSGSIYRVRVGRYEKKADAEKLARQIREREGHETMVVPEEQ